MVRWWPAICTLPDAYNNLTDEQYGRIFIHPEHGKTYRVDENIGVYAWHCNHHLAHITETKKRNNWN